MCTPVSIAKTRSSRGSKLWEIRRVLHPIRADFDASTITVYQAYSPAIADAAVAAGRFVEPFSFRRMTWVKPSLLWLAHRSNWARSRGQERILAVRMTRTGWDAALGEGVLTSGTGRCA